MENVFAILFGSLSILAAVLLALVAVICYYIACYIAIPFIVLFGLLSIAAAIANFKQVKFR